jgi:DNA polymerase I-like protein with 3'-5' exonuclease and polymerase domains
MTKNFSVKNSQLKIKPASVNENWFVFDIETNGLYDKASTTFCVVLHDINKQQTFTYGPDCIATALEHLATADVLIGHNVIFYDLPVLEKLYSFKTTACVIDTLICTRLIWPKEILEELDNEQYPQVPEKNRGSASLKAWGYRLADHKIEFKDFSGYSQEMLEYCTQDVMVTYKLWQHIVKQNYAESALKLEHDFALAINRQIRAGFPFDVDKCLDLVDDLRAKQAELEVHLKELFPPIKHEQVFIPKVNNKSRGYIKGEPFTKVRYEEFNPGSRQQIADRLNQKYNWVPEKITEKGNPMLDDDILSALPYPEAQPLAEYMLIKKRLGQIADGRNAWLKLVNNDDLCVHGDLVTNGCITGRCAHRNPNMGQVPASYSPYGKECRSLFHPPYGWSLIGVDAKALELRCLAGYLAIWDNGEYARLVTDESIDIHTYNQEQFGVETRDISKRLLYGMLYGCGAAKAGTIIDPNEKNPEVLRQLGSTAINGFMNGVPALRALKNNLSLTIQSRGYLRGLDQRALFCRSEFKGLNVLLQAAGALIMKQVVINLHNNLDSMGLVHGKDWIQHAMVHDEIQLSCPEDLIETVQQQALQAFPQAQQFFGFRCSIDGDSKVGSNWSETH